MPMKFPQLPKARILQRIRRNRPKIEPGMIFALQTAGGHYLFGRVVKPVELGGGKCALVYIYKHVAKSIEDVPTEFPLSELLIPPRIVAQNMWTMGEFVKVGYKPFGPGELMKHHVFQWGPQKVNEDGQVVRAGPKPTEKYFLIMEAGLQQDIQVATGNRRI